MLSYQTVYRLDHQVLIPRTCRTTAGFRIHTDPVAIHPVTSPSPIAATLLALIEAGNPTVPTPSVADFKKRSAVVRAAGMKTWREFARQASSWSIEDDEGVFTLTRQALGDKDSFVPSDNKTEYPAYTPLPEIVDLIVQAVRHG